VQIATPEELLQRARAQIPIVAIHSSLAAFEEDVYLVGGTVRDLILGRPFIDVDLAVDGDPLALADAIGSAERLETKFGTVSVQRDGYRYDLARTRTERYEHPGALPVVAPAGIDDDLGRRDFTVNAIALGIAGSRTGELLASPSALEDLRAGQLAVLHDRSFLDDPTRLFRLARYAARLGFEPAPHTRELANKALRDDVLATISGTRTGNELRLLATEPDPVAAFEAVAELGLPWGIDAVLARNTLAVLPDDGRADLLVLACVFGPQPIEQLTAELDRLAFTAADRDKIVQGATHAAELARRLTGARTAAEIVRTVGASGIETVALAFGHGSPSQAPMWLRDLRHLSVQITGEDLIRHGIPEGPAIGRALLAATDALMDGTAPDRESQLRVALEAAE
jgi:tRNA nucleotidyltransferase (CCA-adding enzyme)